MDTCQYEVFDKIYGQYKVYNKNNGEIPLLIYYLAFFEFQGKKGSLKYFIDQCHELTGVNFETLVDKVENLLNRRFDKNLADIQKEYQLKIKTYARGKSIDSFISLINDDYLRTLTKNHNQMNSLASKREKLIIDLENSWSMTGSLAVNTHYALPPELKVEIAKYAFELIKNDPYDNVRKSVLSALFTDWEKTLIPDIFVESSGGMVVPKPPNCQLCGKVKTLTSYGTFRNKKWYGLYLNECYCAREEESEESEYS